jgi:ribosomal protein L37AE/L43A
MSISSNIIKSDTVHFTKICDVCKLEIRGIDYISVNISMFDKIRLEKQEYLHICKECNKSEIEFILVKKHNSPLWKCNICGKENFTSVCCNTTSKFLGKVEGDYKLKNE